MLNDKLGKCGNERQQNAEDAAHKGYPILTDGRYVLAKGWLRHMSEFNTVGRHHFSSAVSARSKTILYNPCNKVSCAVQCTELR